MNGQACGAGVNKIMKHAEYQNKVKTMDDAALRFLIDDCRKVLAAWKDHPNAGYYADEIHYCSAELKRRG